MAEHDDLEDWLLPALEEMRMERTFAYERAGRRFATLTDDRLTADWLAAFRRYVASATRGQCGDDLHGELESEMRLRGCEPPLAVVASEIGSLKALVSASREFLASPEVSAEMIGPVLERIAKLKGMRNGN